MEELPLTRKFSGYDLKQIFQNEDGYIYEKSYRGQVVSYEVFQRKIRKPVMIYGAEYPEQVVYPSINAFGSGWAWDCRKLDEAMKRLAELKHMGLVEVDVDMEMDNHDNEEEEEVVVEDEEV